MMSSKNRVVVITGASSGIGRATALRFAKAGASLVLASRREHALTELAQECERVGAQGAIAVPTDTADAESVKAVADAAVERFGRIDVWVNNAAVGLYAPFLDVPLDDFRRVIDVNVMGYVYGARAALDVMNKQGKGVLINVSSIVGEVPQPYSSAYGMSKAAVRSLGASLRSEQLLKKTKGIKVSTIMPAAIDTPFFRHAANYTGRKVLAMPPVFSADKVARTIVNVSKVPRSEVAVGATSKAMVRQHRKTPKSVEAQMAMQVEKSHLGRRQTAGDTSGTLYTPDTNPADAEVTGGWHGKQRLARRRVLGGAALVASAIALWKSRTVRAFVIRRYLQPVLMVAGLAAEKRPQRNRFQRLLRLS
jgi:short-subunit dehydrogenase